jgi:four helix bundle protein
MLYEMATKMPKEEIFGLTNQIKRSAVSIPANIAEGCGKFTDKNFALFLDNSLGSLNETDYCCFAAMELKYITQNKYEVINTVINEVRGMLISFLKFLRNKV